MAGGRLLRLSGRLPRRHREPRRRSLGARGRRERRAQHGRGPGPNQPRGMGQGPRPRYPRRRTGRMGDSYRRLQQRPGLRGARGTSRAVPGLHARWDPHHGRSRIAHLPELPQAPRRDLRAAAAVLRLRLRGRDPARGRPVQLGVRPGQLQRARRLLQHRPLPRRGADPRMQDDDPGPAPRGVQGHHGRGLQPHVLRRQLVRTHGARLLLPPHGRWGARQRFRLRQRHGQRTRDVRPVHCGFGDVLGPRIPHRRLPLRPDGPDRRGDHERRARLGRRAAGRAADPAVRRAVVGHRLGRGTRDDPGEQGRRGPAGPPYRLVLRRHSRLDQRTRAVLRSGRVRQRTRPGVRPVRAQGGGRLARRGGRAEGPDAAGAVRLRARRPDAVGQAVRHDVPGRADGGGLRGLRRVRRGGRGSGGSCRWRRGGRCGRRRNRRMPR